MTPVKDVTSPPRAAEIEFVDFKFQRPQPAHGGVFLFAFDGEPARGVRYPVDARIAGQEAIASLRFDVVDEDGTIVEPVAMAVRGTGVPGLVEFIGMLTVPARPFRILLSGQTVDGRGFRGLHDRLFRPGTGSLDIPPDAPVPLEYAGQRRLMEEEARRLVAEQERYVADKSGTPLVMPRTIVSKVMYAPLLSAGGRPVGLRVTYDVEFSQGGQHNPRVSVHAEDIEEPSGVLAQLNVLNSRLEPLPRLAHAPAGLAGTNHQASVLAYGADFLYEARTVYHFSVDLVPGFMSTRGDGSSPCIWREGFQTAPDPAKAFNRLLARERPATYRVRIGGEAFDGRIENFAGEGTIYRSFVAEGAPDCAPFGR
jgi:hypothetical protein